MQLSLFKIYTSNNPKSYTSNKIVGNNISFGNAAKTVTLNTGKEVPSSVVKAVMKRLRPLMQQGIPGKILLSDLKRATERPDHRFFGINRQRLQEFGLIQPDGKIPDPVKEVVNAATQGDGLDVSIVNPFSKE